MKTRQIHDVTGSGGAKAGRSVLAHDQFDLHIKFQGYTVRQRISKQTQMHRIQTSVKFKNSGVRHWSREEVSSEVSQINCIHGGHRTVTNQGCLEEGIKAKYL